MKKKGKVLFYISIIYFLYNINNNFYIYLESRDGRVSFGLSELLMALCEHGCDLALRENPLRQPATDRPYLDFEGLFEAPPSSRSQQKVRAFLAYLLVDFV